MLGFGPNGTRPIASLRDRDSFSVAIVATATLEAIFSNPLGDLMSDPRKRLVLAAQIAMVNVGPD